MDVVTDAWWQNRFDDAIQAARLRYVPELSIDVPAVAAIAALCGDPAWRAVLADQITALQGCLVNVRSAADDALVADLAAVWGTGDAVVTAWETWRDMPSTATWGDIDVTLACALTATSGADGRRCIQLRWGSVVAASSPWRVRACGYRADRGGQL